MKIALLNLPLDNNYGGNLQRYALSKTLCNMGHDVIFLNCISQPYKLPLVKQPFVYVKRMALKYLFGHDIIIFSEKEHEKETKRLQSLAVEFTHKYLHVSPEIRNKRSLVDYVSANSFDAFVVGSDQVWRKKMTNSYGIDTYFLDFLYGIHNVKKIAFAVSFGTDDNELTNEDIRRLGKFYNEFDAVSVREKSGLELLRNYNWVKPNPELIIDPTFLLDRTEYLNLVYDNSTVPSCGDMFCYILDPSIEKEQIIKEEALKRKLVPFMASISGDSDIISIPQWLRSFEDAKFVVTDSFHGAVFSIIFNKPFKLVLNNFRGNARFESLFNLLNIDKAATNQDWDNINSLIRLYNCKSSEFLKKSLK